MLLGELGKGWDDPLCTAAQCGFHLVFDGGVKHLISVVADGGGSSRVEDKDEDDGRTKIGPLLV